MSNGDIPGNLPWQNKAGPGQLPRVSSHYETESHATANATYTQTGPGNTPATKIGSCYHKTSAASSRYQVESKLGSISLVENPLPR